MGTNMLLVLQDLIREAQIKGDTTAVKHYKTILGDLQRINLKEVTKLEFTLWLKTQFKSIETAHKDAADVGLVYTPDHDYLNILAELEHNYALTQLTEMQIRNYFADLIVINPKMNKGLLMKAIKEDYPGRYDGKLAAQIAGEFH